MCRIKGWSNLCFLAIAVLAFACGNKQDVLVTKLRGQAIGHDYPVYIGFRGGRGVATSFGVYAALAMPLAVGMVAVGIFIVLTLRYMSVMSLVTVPTGADSIYETDETFTMTLTAVTSADSVTSQPNAALGTSSAVGTIRNDDAVPTVAVCGLPAWTWMDCPPSFVSVNVAGFATPG